MIMCVLLCYPVSIHMSRLLSTGRPISSFRSIQPQLNDLELLDYCSVKHIEDLTQV